MKMLLIVAMLMGWGAGAWAESNVSTVSTKFSATGDVTNNFTQTGDFTSAAWNLAVTWSSEASWQNLDTNKGAQIGSGTKPATQIVLTGSNVPGTITSVVVNTSGASSVNATVSVKVGTAEFKCNNQTTASLTSSATDYTFWGARSGDVVITWNNSSSKAIYIKSITINYTTTSVCAAPTFSPTPGLYASAQNVTISTGTADADIYYTTNGSDPTTNSSKYSSPISVSETTTIKAMAVKSGCENSAIESATYVILQHAGTEADPYTVADARAAIDAGQGITGVYAKGFVSEIVTAHNGTNISFNIVNEKGDQVSLQAYKCTGTESANVAVGDEVVVSGNLTKYNTIYEFSQNCTLVSRIPSAWPSITIATTTINAPCDAVDGTLDVTYKNIADATYDVQFCDANGGALEGDAPDWVTLDIDNDHNVAYHIDANQDQSRSTCFKVCAVMGDVTAESDIITINQAKYVAPASLPFNWAGGASSGLTALDGVTANGLGSDYASTNAPYLTKLDGDGDYIQVYCNQRPGQVTIGVKMIGGAITSSFTVQGSADGETFTNVETLTISGAQNSELTLKTSKPFAANHRYVRLLFKKGSNVGVGAISIEEFVQSITVAPDEVDVPYADASGSLAITSKNLTISGASDFKYAYYESVTDAENGGQGNNIDWIQEISIGGNYQEGYQLHYSLSDNDGAARTAYVRLYVEEGDEEIYTIVTINQAAAPAEYTLTVEPLENMGLFVFAGDESETVLEGAGNAQVLSGTEVMLSPDPAEGYVLQSLLVNGVEHVNDINDGGMYIFEMPEENVIVTATAIIAPIAINFGNAEGSTKINNNSVTGNDSAGNTWTVTTETTTEYFSQNPSYSQVGSSNNPATSITFTTTLENEPTITEFSAKFGGFSGTTGTITMNVGDEVVATGSLNGQDDVLVTCTPNIAGKTLTVTVTNIAKGVKCYYISYRIASEEVPSEVTKEVTSHGWATYIPEYNVEFEEGDAWVVTAATQTNGITLAPVSSVPAQTPVLLKGEGTKTMTVIESASAPETNLLEVYNGTTVSGKWPWVLAIDGDGAAFKQWTGEMSDLQGRVLMWLDFKDGNGTRTLALDEDGTQGISDVQRSTLNAKCYTDLQGRHVAQPSKGLYIVNGKKVIIK